MEAIGLVTGLILVLLEALAAQQAGMSPQMVPPFGYSAYPSPTHYYGMKPPPSPLLSYPLSANLPPPYLAPPNPAPANPAPYLAPPNHAPPNHPPLNPAPAIPAANPPPPNPPPASPAPPNPPPQQAPSPN